MIVLIKFNTWVITLLIHLLKYDFIVWVPTAVYNTLGNDTANRYNNVYNFVVNMY
jgi:hypothetical protein